MMSQNPLVSVAIITYNQKIFLEECIESILLQTYKNIEIIIADDGSSDGTHQLAQNFQENYPDIKFKLALSKLNFGITNNSNLAFENCSGKYIAWMGGDDLMHPKKLKLKFGLWKVTRVAL